MSENKQTTDSELLLQIVGYNQNAFEELYNRYSATIYSLIKEIVTNPKLAEKILLNVFSVFLKRIDHYSTNSNNVFTWLTLLARNISIDTLKRMKFVEDIPIYSDDYETEFILPNLSQEISLISLNERETLGEKIKSYKNHLSEVQNLVLSLIYFEGLNEEEIAKRLNVPAATVRQKTLSIMETLHNHYTGKVEQIINNKDLLNLVKLESLGYLSSEERMLFNQMRNNDPDFLWIEYGEYQNLTALLSTTITIVKPAHELNAELKSIFTKILQGSDVDYPIIASEIPIVETLTNSLPEPLLEKTIAPEVKEKVETKEEKDSGFHIRFRERDPKELSLLKKLETVEIKPTPAAAPVHAKVEKEIQFRDYRTAVKKPNILSDRKDTVLNNNEIVKPVIADDKTMQGKFSNTEIKRPEIQIENDDSLIIIEEPKPIMVKDNATINNKLIPNSSINFKEIFKKDNKPLDKNETNQTNTKAESVIQSKPVIPVIESQDIKQKINETINAVQQKESVLTKEEKIFLNNPAVPAVDKPDIKFKTNEVPKEFRKSNVFVDKDDKAVQQKTGVPGIEKMETVKKTNELTNETNKTETIVLKEDQIILNKPTASVVEKSDIKIKTNEAPKEFSKSNLFVDKTIKPFEQKSPVPVVEKTEIVNKPNELFKENRITERTIAKVEQILQNKPSDPVVNKSDIKIKTNEPPVENQQQKPSVLKAETQAQINLKAKTTTQPEVKINEQKKETSKNVTSIEKIEQSIQTAVNTPVIAKPEIRFRTNDTPKQKEEIKQVIKEDQNKSRSINSSVDKSNLRIRETVFTEKLSKPETKGKDTSSSVNQSNADNEIIPAVKALTDSINIDEILTKIEDENPATAEISETDSYEKEIVNLRKKLRRNILVSAAMFVIIIASSIFVFLKFQESPVKVSAKGNNSEKLNLAGQTNIVLNSEYKPEIDTKNIVAANETTLPEQSLTNQKVVIPPLSESLTKEESTLFASSINTDLIIDEDKEPTQIAAAKTETIIPPKEIEKFEEEPAFFVAVEEMPQLIGGLKGIQGQIKYPEIAKRVGVEGKVIVQAIVDETGKVISVNTIKGIGSGCDEVAMDAVRNSKFTPGKQRGKNVKVQVTIPIVFKK